MTDGQSEACEMIDSSANYPDHFDYAPSGMERTIECPGSVKQPQIQQPDNVYTSEGTVAHELATFYLLGKPIPPHIARQMNDEMVEHVTDYVAYCIDNAITMPNRLVEQKVKHPTFHNFGGTPDFVAWNNSNGLIVDLKYGAGIRVEAHPNWQLLSYACLASYLMPATVEDIKAVIFQPRLGNISAIYISKAEIEEFEKLLAKIMKQNFLKTGKHCKWCPALTLCPQMKEESKKAIDELDDLDETFVNKHIQHYLELLPAMKRLIELVPDMALKAMEEGTQFNGFKAVRSIGHTQWIVDDESMMEYFKKKRLRKSDYLETKLMSPTKLRKKGYGALIEGKIHRPDRGLVVVEEADRRTAHQFATNIDDLI